MTATAHRKKITEKSKQSADTSESDARLTLNEERLLVAIEEIEMDNAYELSEDPDITTDEPLPSRLPTRRSLHFQSPRASVVMHDSKFLQWLRVQFIIVVVVLLVLCFVYWRHTLAYTQAVLEWIGGHPYWGSVILVLLSAALIVVAVPPWIMGIGCGFTYYQHFGFGGIIFGTFIVFTGYALGGTLSFLLSRYLFRGCVVRLTRHNETFNVVEKLVRNYGFRVVFMLRLSPIIPFVLANYLFGVTSVTFKSYLFAFIGELHGCFLQVFVGSTIRHLSNLSDAKDAMGDSKLATVFLVIGIASTVIAGIAFTVYAKREMERMSQRLSIDVDGDLDDVDLEAMETLRTSRTSLSSPPTYARLESPRALNHTNEGEPE